MTLSFARKVECDFCGYRRTAVGDPYDDNLLDVRIVVCVEDFRTQVDGVFIVRELDVLLDRLRRLHENLGDAVDFVSQRGHIRLHLVGDGLGHIACSGEVSSDACSSRAQFAFDFDQTELKATISQIQKVMSTFPARAA